MSNKPRILHVSAASRWGGGENHLLNLCQEMDSATHVVLCRKGSDLFNRLQLENIEVYSSPLFTKFDLRFVWKIIALCKKHQIDLVHIHDTTALTLSIMATYLSKKLPLYILSKKTSFPIKDRKRTLYKYNHEQIKKILCVSDITRQITSERVTDSSKLVTVYHGTRVPKQLKPEVDLRKIYQISEDALLVGTIANHIRAKNLETWISTIDHMVNKLGYTQFYFILIGSKTDRTANYLQKIKDKGLEKYCLFTGFIPDASALIPQFDISLMTSQSEGIPQFIYESFYYKVPVIATEVGGIPEIIENGINGLLSRPHDGASLANKLVLLSQDRSLQQKFTNISYQQLLENYTTERMAASTMAQYKEVLYGKNGTGS
ncbi:glycosyltransferase family 4 protein [Christiangramia portivictoriae]|uniref:glycosyltransferase family 4 protein n=1 Tax=Christiangramia portivictoriae TaxID=326069 RepID=UPI000406EF4B|nr:glycosyltransferase family 4 protein [Christiangramia portivictoriae]